MLDMDDVRSQATQATVMTLASYSDNYFAQWVEWGYTFCNRLNDSYLTDTEKAVIRDILCLEVTSNAQFR